MKPGKAGLLVFDLDGTLIDSAEDLLHALNRMLAEIGRAPVTLAQIHKMIGDGTGVLVARALEARPGEPVEESAALRRFLELYEAEAVARTTLYPGVAETLARLDSSGYRLAVCTNKPERACRHILEVLGVADYFDWMVGGDSLPWRKPDPRMLTGLVDETGFALGQTVMIGDSEVDAATAAAASVRFVLMTYGYHRGAISAIRCEAALDRFDALPALFAASETEAVR